jgi:hypothetical protein
MNQCVICGIDMGSENPRQLCGKVSCCNESEHFELLSSQLTVRCNPGWINSLGLTIEQSDGDQNRIMKRLIPNLNRSWRYLNSIPVTRLVNMTSTEITELVRVLPTTTLPIIGQPTSSTLESIHESGGNWFRE